MTESARHGTYRLGPVESSLLEHVLCFHGPRVERRAALACLVVHAQLLARGARLESSGSASILDVNSLNSDPIRLSYVLVSRPKSETLATTSCQLQLSVVETDAQIFINLTDIATDKFGHIEISGVEHVRLGCTEQCTAGDFHYVFPQLNELLGMIDEHLCNPVLPPPPLQQRSPEPVQSIDQRSDQIPEEFGRQPRPGRPFVYDPIHPGQTPFPDYGRSDLDPFGFGSIGGGMIMDPRRPSPIGGGSFIGGPEALPPGAVPPGARFDPFGPGVMPTRPRLGGPRPRGPDPDHAMPPGFEDMYL